MKNELDELKAKYASYSVDEFVALIAKLEGQLSHFKSLLFASKKERFISDPPGMNNMFDEIEDILAKVEKEKTAGDCEEDLIEVKGHKKKRGKRSPLPDNLPRVRVEVDLDPSQKVCSIHNVSLEKIGETVTEKLEIVPSSVHIVEEAVLRYQCPCCSADGLKVVAAERAPDLIPKSFATPSLLAYITVAKYEDALPLYRQEKIFDRLSIGLDRTTMARWMIATAEACQPLINLMQDDLLETPVVHCDETPVQVLKEPNRRPEQKSYMWCLARQGDSPIILFRYFEKRDKKAVENLLAGYAGVLVCDGYKVYDSLAMSEDCTVAGCMAHCRRKFFAAEKAANQAGTKGVKAIASTALGFIRQLYAIEKSIKGEDPSQILKFRTEKSVPILATFHKWLEEQATVVLPKSPTGKAISYTINQWAKLNYYASDGAVPIDNNYLEGHLRPFVVGRKNWMFSASVRGADASASLYSLTESAKANGIQPYAYLKLIFKELPKAAVTDDYHRLLPHKVKNHFNLASYTIPT